MKELVFEIRAGAFGIFKYESGVHRVQRVPLPITGRIHTSTVVAVLPGRRGGCGD